MKKLLLMGAAIFCMGTTPALANNFSGAFLGLNTGYSFGDVDYDYEDGTTGNGDFSEDQGFDGFEGGIFAGYRHQFLSGFNLSIEGGYTLSKADGSYNLTVGANNFAANFEKKNEWYISLKPGYLINEQTLAYGILGYQRGKFDSELVLNGTSLGSNDDTFDGYHLGVGLERMLTDNISVRGEYRYNKYSDNDYSYANGQVETFGGDESVVRVGVTYNFNSHQ